MRERSEEPVEHARRTIDAMMRYAKAAHLAAGFEAVILFGSRARGSARASSDWDLCVVGGPNENDVTATLRQHIPAAEILPPIDVLWTPNSAALAERASAGTVWAHIVAEGRVLAGDNTMLNKIEIAPIKPETISERIDVMLYKLDHAVQALEPEPDESRRDRESRMKIGTESTTHAAEALTWLLAAFAGVPQHDRFHRISECANNAYEKADQNAEEEEIAETLRTLGRCIEAMNGGSRDGRKVLYDGRYTETQKVWERRIVGILRATHDLLNGCLRGAGPLGRLATETQSAGLQTTLAGEALRLSARAKRWTSHRSHSPKSALWSSLLRFSAQMSEIAKQHIPPPGNEI